MIRRNFFRFLGGLCGFSTVTNAATPLRADGDLGKIEDAKYLNKRASFSEMEPFDRHPGAVWPRLNNELKASIEKDVMN